MERIDIDTINKMKKYIKRLKISCTDWWRYYHLSAKTIEKLKECDLDFLDVSNKEYKSIKKITKDKKSLLSMALTDKIVERFKRVIDEFGLEGTAKEIGRPKEFLEEIINKKRKTIEIVVKERMYRFYNDIIKDEEDKRLIKKCSKVNIDAISKRDAKIIRRINKMFFRPLEVGKYYKISEKRYQSQRFTEELVFEGKIIKEYKSYYLAKHGDRNVTFLKNMLYMTDVIVREVASDGVSKLQERLYA